MPLKAIPVIDISPFKSGDATSRKCVVEKVAQACIEIGFLIISGHGIPSSTIQNVVTASKTFFGLHPKEKSKVVRPRPEIIRGYGGLESERLAYTQDEETPPDLKEVFDVGPMDVPNTSITGACRGRALRRQSLAEQTFRSQRNLQDYFHRMESLTLEMAHIFAAALDLPMNFFDTKLDRHISILRANYYPRLSRPPRAKQLRGGEHSTTPPLRSCGRNASRRWVFRREVPGANR